MDHSTKMLNIIKAYRRFVVSFAFITVILKVTEGKNCETLDGEWFNQLGSAVVFQHTQDGLLFGEFRTAVERETGSSGLPHSKVYGAENYKTPGSVFGFTVSYKNGNSTSAWTGQCQVCANSEEVLYTTWVLRVRVDTCLDKWKSTLIGQDVFTRYLQRTAVFDNNVPDYISYGENNVDVPRNRPITREKRGVSAKCSSIAGTWYNSVGSELILTEEADGQLNGEYRTAVEREKGAAGTTHSTVFGYRASSEQNATLNFFVVWNNGESVTGWVGQCHICENNTEVIETTWLLRSKVTSCDDNWKSTLHGENSFTRSEQKDGPRKLDGIHTPQQAGEVLLQPVLHCGSHATQPPCGFLCLSMALLLKCINAML